MSQFKEGEYYTRNAWAACDASLPILVDTTPGCRYRVTEIFGHRITFVDDVGDAITVDHVQFNRHFNAPAPTEPEPQVDTTPVSRAEFNQLLEIATKLAGKVDELEGRVNAAEFGMIDMDRAIRNNERNIYRLER